MSVSRFGNQEPTFEVIGPYAYTDGPEIVSTFESYGFQFMPWQKHKLDIYGARNEDGSFASIDINDSTPRRNGKSFPTRLYAAWEAAVEGNRVLYSAHNGSTVTEMFKELRKLFEDEVKYEDWVETVELIYKQPGREGIYLNNGGCIEFNTRTTSGARGTGYKVIIVDEAQEFTDEQADSLLPTSAAAASSDSLVVEDPQIIYIGTPDYPKCKGTVFRRAHEVAHSDNPGDIWWTEYGITELPLSDISKADIEELMYQTNPGLGYRVSTRALFMLGKKMSWDGFCREILGWWYPNQADKTRAIPAKLWKKSAIIGIGNSYPAKTTFGVKFSPDGAAYALGGCKLDKRGNAAIELVEVGSTERGTRALARALKSRSSAASCVVIDGQAGAPALCDNLEELKAPRGFAVRPRVGDVIAAAGMLLDGLRDGTLKHTEGTWQKALEDSALNSTRRAIGSHGGWGFGGDSIAIEACALALFGAKTSKRNPKRKQRAL